MKRKRKRFSNKSVFFRLQFAKIRVKTNTRLFRETLRRRKKPPAREFLTLEDFLRIFRCGVRDKPTGITGALRHSEKKSRSKVRAWLLLGWTWSRDKNNIRQSKYPRSIDWTHPRKIRQTKDRSKVRAIRAKSPRNRELRERIPLSLSISCAEDIFIARVWFRSIIQYLLPINLKKILSESTRIPQ